MYKNLLVGADSSATALRAVEAAVELAQVLGARLHIVTAYKPESVSVPDLPAEFRYTANVHPADALLDELKAIAKRAKVPVGSTLRPESRLKPSAESRPGLTPTWSSSAIRA